MCQYHTIQTFIRSVNNHYPVQNGKLNVNLFLDERGICKTLCSVLYDAHEKYMCDVLARYDIKNVIGNKKAQNK